MATNSPSSTDEDRIRVLEQDFGFRKGAKVLVRFGGGHFSCGVIHKELSSDIPSLIDVLVKFYDSGSVAPFNVEACYTAKLIVSKYDDAKSILERVEAAELAVAFCRGDWRETLS